MAETTRTFLALDLDEPSRRSLSRFMTGLAMDVSGAKWVAPELLHATLAFLGDVENKRLPRLFEAVSKAVTNHHPFSLDLEGIGCFPDPRNPRVLWAGLKGGGLEPLAKLHASLLRSLKEAGFQPDRDRLGAHVTLARFKPGRARHLTVDLGPFLTAHAQDRFGTLNVGAISVFGSQLGPLGPQYSSLHRAALIPPENQPPAGS